MARDRVAMRWWFFCAPRTAKNDALEIGYAKFSRSHDPVIRVYDDAGNVIKTAGCFGKRSKPHRH
jgi:hypothetical protein